MNKEEMDKQRNKDLDTSLDIIATAMMSMEHTLAVLGPKLSSEDKATVENDLRALNRTGQLLTYLRQDDAMDTSAVANVSESNTIH